MSGQGPDRIFVLAALGCTLTGAACGIRWRRIPNWLTGTSILMGPALRLGLRGWNGLGHGLKSWLPPCSWAVLFAMLFALYKARLQALLANLASPLAHHGTVGLVPHPELNLTSPLTLRLPYGIAIAAGAVVLPWSALLR